jgi:hypothetical protein
VGSSRESVRKKIQPGVARFILAPVIAEDYDMKRKQIKLLMDLGARG